MKDDSRDWLPGGHNLYFILDEHRNPQPAELLEWGLWLEAERRKPNGGLGRVADSVLPGGFRVATIFIGLDFRLGVEAGPPLLFETMAFYPAGRRRYDKWFEGPFSGRRRLVYRRGRRYSDDIVSLRYSTWDGAAAGHAGVLEAVRRSRIELQAAYASGEERQRERVANRVGERIERNAKR
jgi:hypothetical protein